MPMVRIAAAIPGEGANPSAGTIHAMLMTHTPPVLRSLNDWGNLIGGVFDDGWFDVSAAWRADLSPVDGSVAGMPSANAGSGDLFNNQYGFMFTANGTDTHAFIPTGKSLAIKMLSISSLDMEAFNYGNATNRWDEVWTAGVGSQVLWNGSMWHNYFTLPASAAPGTYTASFEIFMANTPFTGSTGFAQYDTAALTAAKDTNFNSATVNYTFTVIPEPTTLSLAALGLTGLAFVARRKGHRRATL